MFEKIITELRKEIQDLIKNMKDGDYHRGNVNFSVWAIDIIGQVAVEYNNGWAPNKEESVKNNGSFLVQSQDGEIFTCEFDGIADGYDNPLWSCNVQIIAWQPLPERYKENK